jgi:hypothetical protein
MPSMGSSMVMMPGAGVSGGNSNACSVVFLKFLNLLCGEYQKKD